MRDAALARDRDLLRNALAILRSLDQHELVNAGVLEADDMAGWIAFRDDPYLTYPTLGDRAQERCFALIQTRLTERLRSDVVEYLVSFRAAHEASGWTGDGFSFGAHLSDAELAARVRMLMRHDLDHESVCVMGRDRIRDLSRELAAARARIVELERRAA